MAMVRIQLHGPFAAFGADSAEIGFQARSAAELVAFLCARRGRRVQRTDTAQALWPESDAAAARTSLRKAIQRARAALPCLMVESDALWLDAATVETDLQVSERHHRQYHLSPDSREGLQNLAAEWEIVRKPFLDRWTSNWIEPSRLRYRLYADEIGCELAEGLEAFGEEENALQVWRSVLDDTPNHIEALQNLIRLEAKVRGSTHALALLQNLSPEGWTEQGVEPPAEFRKVVRAIRANSANLLDKPDRFRTKSQWKLLTKLIESNLDRGGDEAIRLLLKESSSAPAQQYPRVMLGILHTALLSEAPPCEDRARLAAKAAVFGSVCSEFDAGLLWADYAIAHLPANDHDAIATLSMKGFMQFEQRQFDQAIATIERALAAARAVEDPNLVCRCQNRMAGVLWHLGRFEEAIALYRGVVQACNATPALEANLRVGALANLVWVHAIQGRVELAASFIPELDQCVRGSIYERFVPIPVGYVQYKLGQHASGSRTLAKALVATLEQNMARFNQLAMEFGCAILHAERRTDLAHAMLDALTAHRKSIQHLRAPAEVAFLKREVGFDERKPTSIVLRGQPSSALNAMMIEALEAITD